jgi:hypothetical protein
VQPLVRLGCAIALIGALATLALSGTSAVASQDGTSDAYRVSRWGVCDRHHLQYLRSVMRSGLFRLDLFVW